MHRWRDTTSALLDLIRSKISSFSIVQLIARTFATVAFRPVEQLDFLHDRSRSFFLTSRKCSHCVHRENDPIATIALIGTRGTCSVSVRVANCITASLLNKDGRCRRGEQGERERKRQNGKTQRRNILYALFRGDSWFS